MHTSDPKAFGLVQRFSTLMWTSDEVASPRNPQIILRAPSGCSLFGVCVASGVQEICFFTHTAWFDSGYSVTRQSTELFAWCSCSSALNVGRTTGRFTLHVARRLTWIRHWKWCGLVDGVKFVEQLGRVKSPHTASRLCCWLHVSSPSFCWVSHMAALSVSRLCSQSVCKFRCQL